MKYSERIDYPQTSAQLLPVFSNPAFFEAKYAATGAHDIRVLETEHGNGRFRIKVSRKVPTDVPIPSFARSLVPQDITLIQTDSWDLEKGVGSLDIEFVGIPVRVHCELLLKDVAGKAVEDLHFDIKVNVPLIGGKLEKLLADDLKVKFTKDTAVTLGMLPQYV